MRAVPHTCTTVNCLWWQASLSAANVIVPNSTRVKVKGLTGAPQHNGHWGQVQEYDRVAGRYVVRLDSGIVKLKPSNCFPG